MLTFEGEIGGVVGKLAQRVQTIVAALAIRAIVRYVLQREGQVVICMTIPATLLIAGKGLVIAVAGRAIQGSYRIIYLVLYQAKVSQRVIEADSGGSRGIKLAPAVLKVAGEAAVGAVHAAMNTLPRSDLVLHPGMALHAEHILGGG